MRATTSAFALAAWLLAAYSPSDGDPAARAPPAVAAARARQEAVRTFDVEFKQTEVIKHPPRPNGPAPAGETVFESVNRLAIDGQKVRYEDNHPQRLTLEMGKKQSKVSVFD